MNTSDQAAIEAFARKVATLGRTVDGLVNTRQVVRSTIETPAGESVPVGDLLGDAHDVVTDYPETALSVDTLDAGQSDDLEYTQANDTLTQLAGDDAYEVRLRLGEAQVELDQTRIELDQKLTEANEQIEQTRTDLTTTKGRLDETFGLATDAKTKAEQAVVSVVDEFAASSSSTTAPETGWSLTPPPPEPGVWVWKRTVEEIGDGTRRIGIPAMLTGPEGAPGAAGADAALLRISSSRGTSFKNNAIGTVLSVTVFLGALQIVNIEGLRAKFGPGAYLEWWWRREDDSGFGLISSNDDRLSQSGFALTVSPADVDEQTIFQCIMHT